MNTIGGLMGFSTDDEESIIVFNELSKRNQPMGRYGTFAVFCDRDGPVPELGKSYYCYLRKDPAGNLYHATIKSEVTMESLLSLNPQMKRELAKIILEEHPEAFREEIVADQIKRYEEKISEKYKVENAALRSKVEHLENELSKLSEISRRELEITPEASGTGIEDGLLHDEDLVDGEYTVRMDLKKSKALFIKCDGGDYYCTSGYIDIKPFLLRYHVTKPVCRHCDELEGALVEF